MTTERCGFINFWLGRLRLGFKNQNLIEKFGSATTLLEKLSWFTTGDVPQVRT